MAQRGRGPAGRTSSTAPIRPEAPSETTSSGARSPRVTILPNEPHPDVGGLVGSGVETDQHRAALGADPPRSQDRLGPGVFVHAEVAAVQNR